MTNTEEVIGRLKEHFLISTDKALREELSDCANIARQTMDLAKRRGTFTKNFEYSVCKKYGFNYEWLKHGLGDKYSEKKAL